MVDLEQLFGHLGIVRGHIRVYPKAHSVSIVLRVQYDRKKLTFCNLVTTLNVGKTRGFAGVKRLHGIGVFVCENGVVKKIDSDCLLRFFLGIKVCKLRFLQLLQIWGKLRNGNIFHIIHL